ncbi:helix-turn-helix domain-containing protein [Microbacterium oleivorans]|uniref:Helix-turn-helix domain-containing protein n=1 Tax=Microbacterium oleivorans TaxID=273677 RepID=A0A7D5EWA2_9MICO|nr:helix-turn-helix domain-containing protein [Microbacterium oleivorans]QLD11386.1 helix-turn-helix domain-containing protein [Microbacterium oleivorans]
MSSLYETELSLSVDSATSFRYEMAALAHPTAATAAVRFTGTMRTSTRSFPRLIAAHAAQGRHRWQIGGESGDGRTAFIVPPDTEFSAEFGHLHLRTFSVTTEVIEHVLRALLGDEPRRIQFSGLNKRAGNPRLVAETLRFLEATALADGKVAASPLMRSQLMHQAVASLVTAFPLIDADETDQRRPTARAVRRAVAFMEENVGNPISIGDIAVAAGTSVRALQSAFHKAYEIPPSTYLRRLRIEGAHHELRAAHPGSATVRDVAMRWGFAHTGRFAQLYAAMYGEHPSHTLRR